MYIRYDFFAAIIKLKSLWQGVILHDFVDYQLKQNCCCTGHTCKAYLQYVYSSCGLSIGHFWYLNSHTVDISEAFPQNGSFCASLKFPIHLKKSCTDCIHEALPPCESQCETLDFQLEWMSSCIAYICASSPRNG